VNSEELYNTYTYAARKLYLKNDFILEDNHEQTAKSFFSSLEKKYFLSSLGQDFLWQYVIFQFDYWSKLTLRSFDRRMKFSFIFGKKALARYLERDQEYDWQWMEGKIAHTLSLKEYKDTFEEKTLHKASIIDTSYRKRFFELEDNIAYCLLYTSLYDPNDTCCNMCHQIDNCKELLRTNYPHLYKVRIKNRSKSHG
jgi:hypothetical protein